MVSLPLPLMVVLAIIFLLSFSLPHYFLNTYAVLPETKIGYCFVTVYTL